MIQPPSQLKPTSKEKREGDYFISVPKVQDQASERIPTPPPSPQKIQHDLFWRETVLYWNSSNYRKYLIEYIPCLLGIIWEEDKMGRIEGMNSFPMEAQYYFLKGSESADIFSTSKTSYHSLFRTKLGSFGRRRASEPDLGTGHYDPRAITEESFLFTKFLKNLVKITKISCTVLILSLKFTQLFLRKIRSTGGATNVELESNQFRLFVTSLLLADKYSEDHPYTNKSWSSLSGLPIEDINTLEMIYLSVMQHEMFVSESEFREWTKSLQNLCHLETIHPENSRRSHYSVFNSDRTRRVSFSNTKEAISFNDDTISSSGSSSINSFSKESDMTTTKSSFWSRFRLQRK